MLSEDIINLVSAWEDTSNDMYEVEEKINQAFKTENHNNYELITDNVFDSPGCDIYVLFLAWVDSDGTLQTVYSKREHC